MLYRIEIPDSGSLSLAPLPFGDFADFQKVEKDLENLLRERLLDLLFAEQPLMPVFRERPFREEADLYALRPDGDMVLFELKRGLAGEEAVHQILRYCQDAGRWTYATLDAKYQEYRKSVGLPKQDLHQAHKEAFELEDPLPLAGFNRRQHLWIIGSAADDKLISAVEYWDRQGLSIDFVPYRLYQLGTGIHFELFSLPYDRHRNPGTLKGVLFDTNRSWDENSVWSMLEQRRVAAYEGARYFADYIDHGDIVFYSHVGKGIVAAARVTGPTKKPSDEEWYHDVEFLTATPTRQTNIRRAVSFRRVTEVTGKSFYWARTVKVPYLTREETDALLEECRATLGLPVQPATV